VRGLDAYETLFADSRRWFTEGWLDYLAPQLYWAVGAPEQSYPELLDWWSAQNRRGRHLWPGNGTYKVTDQGSVRWRSAELLQQISLTRDQTGASGNVHYNMTALVRSTDALADRLTSGPYAAPALVPASPWLSPAAPPAPEVSITSAPRRITLRITSAGVQLRWWLVRARYGGLWHAQVVDASSRTVTMGPARSGDMPDFLVVTAVDRAGVESAPVRVIPE
jgi:hypothetical protein